MLSYDPAANETLRALRRTLDRHQYDFLLRGIRGLYYSFEPWLGDEAYRFYHETTPLPDANRALFELFLMGRSISRERAEDALGFVLCSELLEIGLLRKDDGGSIATDQYAIISQNGLYFITTYQSQHNPRRAFNVYIGRDSFKLFHGLDHSRRGIRGLDLCSGSGILGQGLLPWARQVVAVELCDEAVHVSRCNAVLNGFESEWEVRKGDLWEPVKDEAFDLILSNPPFVAMPVDIEIPIYGWGGKDGLLFIERILSGLGSHFNPGGRAQMVFEGIGSAHDIAVIPLLEAFIQEHSRWSASLLLYDRVLLSKQSCRLFGEAAAFLAGTPTPEYIEQVTTQVFEAFQAQNMRYMYRMLLDIDSEPLSQPGLVCHHIYNPWDNDVVPSFKNFVYLQEEPNFNLNTIHGVSLGMTPIEKEICASFDGKTSLEQAARHAWQQRGGADSGVAPEAFIAQSIELARIMHQIDYLLPPANTHWDPAHVTKNPFVQEVEDSAFFKAWEEMKEAAQEKKQG